MDTNYEIARLDPADFKKCGHIWDMERQGELAETFYRQLLQGVRITYVCRLDRQFIGEISLVLDMEAGSREILFIGEDGDGKYAKLLRRL